MSNTTCLVNQAVEKNRRIELAKFLRNRRERLNPKEYNLLVSLRRRTLGLRREEVAQLAGVGVSWYTWLEQGRPITVSEQVLESITHVLKLDWAERRHLFLLARDHPPSLPQRNENTPPIIPGLQDILDAFGICPAYALDRCWNIVSWNRSACEVFVDFSTLPAQEQNFVWLLFTHPAMTDRLLNWETLARRCLAVFRFGTDQYIGESWYIEFVENIKCANPLFREWWEQYDIATTPPERKEFNHPKVGRLVLRPTVLSLPAAPELKIVVYTPFPDENTAEKLAKLIRLTGTS
ncbi:helix-turn-helix transcriptional regulator [Pelosinus baikalensis]|uniref:Helix-turn-helix transcriptional regulator n=1 Tax=Pelosinus baikalensis TaxID=2892015 RepID=A0ABS8HU07_9FIRM|nr:helix-turn-helix transcriptional regulator [Pelosinus baikalensis]MCC5466650.1 helix-turn-helix transcriptional regulator [Pelosinus baikalensis]